MFSKFFIDRPVLAGVIAIVIVIAGLVASATLPIAQYPDIAPPTVTVNTSYPGASAETIAKTVAAPIEERLSGVENLLYFNSSSSSTGDLTITATFDVGTNIDTAVFNVNNRVQLALPRLPDEVRRNGVTVQKRSQDILLLVALVSPDNSRDTLFLSNYATINLVDELKRVPGVADVGVFGARDYSMRIWLRPDRLPRSSDGNRIASHDWQRGPARVDGHLAMSRGTRRATRGGESWVMVTAAASWMHG
jgi:multidrug efflux pump subunit AcrB